MTMPDQPKLGKGNIKPHLLGEQSEHGGASPAVPGSRQKCRQGQSGLWAELTETQASSPLKPGASSETSVDLKKDTW